MFIRVAYLVKPKAELISAIIRIDSDLAEYLTKTQLILREDERRVFGSYSELEWTTLRANEVKEAFMERLLNDMNNWDADLKDAVYGLLETAQSKSAIFDQWWLMERIENIVNFDEL